MGGGGGVGVARGAGGAPPGASGYTGGGPPPGGGGGGLPFQPCQLIKSSDGVKVPASTSGYPKAVLAQNLE